MAGTTIDISTEALAWRLREARERTLQLIEPLAEEQLHRQYTTILSPLIWDLGHIANFEELWLVRELGGLERLAGGLGDIYDAFENPRSERSELPLLHGDACLDYMAAVRERSLEILERTDLEAPGLARDGYVFELIIAHEHQHTETMLQLLQMVEHYEPVEHEPAPGAGETAPGPEMVEVDPADDATVGAGPGGFAYDNERPCHRPEVPPFAIDRVPVTNEAFAAFVADTAAEPPLYWEPDGEGWWTRTVMGATHAVDPAEPVVHVDAGQADAYARWAGKRLPIEAEWELAAAGANREAANLDQLAFGPAPAGAYQDGASIHGAVQMLGDVWEWTASEFAGYPGFEPFPYPEYSQVFFGQGLRVLRGGAWATRRNVVRASFRNWDLPERRQIFSGFRCARDL